MEGDNKMPETAESDQGNNSNEFVVPLPPLPRASNLKIAKAAKVENIVEAVAAAAEEEPPSPSPSPQPEVVYQHDSHMVEHHYPSGFCKNLASMIEKNHFRIVGESSEKKLLEKKKHLDIWKSSQAKNTDEHHDDSEKVVEQQPQVESAELQVEQAQVAQVTTNNHDDADDSTDESEQQQSVEGEEPQQNDSTERIDAHNPGVEKVPKWSPTVVPKNDFNANADASMIIKAMKNLKKCKTGIIQVLADRNNSQRQEIAKQFQIIRKRVLADKLKSKFPAPLNVLLVSMVTPLPQFYAQQINSAMKHLHRQKVAPIEIFFTLSNEEVHYVKESYTLLYGTTLEKDLESDPHLPYGITTQYLKNNLRDQFEEASKDRKGREKEIFIKAMEKNMKNMQDRFQRIIMRSFIDFVRSVSWKEVKEIFEPCAEEASWDGNTLGVKASNQLQQFFAYLCRVQREPHFFVNIQAARQDARRLYHDKKWKLGDEDCVLNEILASRNVSQLEQIFIEYEKMAGNGYKIEDAIQYYFSGGVDTYLLAIVKCIKDRPAFFANQIYASIETLVSDTLDYNQLFRLVITRSERDMGQIKETFLRVYNITLEKFLNKIPDEDIKMCLTELIST